MSQLFKLSVEELSLFNPEESPSPSANPSATGDALILTLSLSSDSGDDDMNKNEENNYNIDEYDGENGEYLQDFSERPQNNGTFALCPEDVLKFKIDNPLKLNMEELDDEEKDKLIDKAYPLPNEVKQYNLNKHQSQKKSKHS